MADLLGVYALFGGMILAFSLFCLGVMVVEYKGYKNHGRSNEFVSEARGWVRIWFFGVLLSPIWPVIVVIVLVKCFMMVLRIVMEED